MTIYSVYDYPQAQNASVVQLKTLLTSYLTASSITKKDFASSTTSEVFLRRELTGTAEMS